jgi:hypothetical protein
MHDGDQRTSTASFVSLIDQPVHQTVLVKCFYVADDPMIEPQRGIIRVIMRKIAARDQQDISFSRDDLDGISDHGSPGLVADDHGTIEQSPGRRRNGSCPSGSVRTAGFRQLNDWDCLKGSEIPC